MAAYQKGLLYIACESIVAIFINRTKVAELMCYYTPKSWDALLNPREYLDRITAYQRELHYVTSESIVTGIGGAQMVPYHICSYLVF